MKNTFGRAVDLIQKKKHKKKHLGLGLPQKMEGKM